MTSAPCSDSRPAGNPSRWPPCSTAARFSLPGQPDRLRGADRRAGSSERRGRARPVRSPRPGRAGWSIGATMPKSVLGDPDHPRGGAAGPPDRCPGRGGRDLELTHQLEGLADEVVAALKDLIPEYCPAWPEGGEKALRGGVAPILLQH